MKTLSLGVKLTGGFLIVGCIVLLVGFIGWKGINTLDGIAMEQQEGNRLEKQFLQGEIDHLNWARKVGQFQRDALITELGIEKDEHKCGFGQWYYSEERKKAGGELPVLKSLLDRMEEPHKRLHQSGQELENILKKGAEFRGQAIALYGGELSAQLKEIQELFAQIRPEVKKHLAEEQAAAKAQGKRTIRLSLAGMVAGALAALILGFFLSRSIVGPIKNIISGLDDGAGQVASASGQVSSASQSLAEGAGEQASSIEETSASLEEMSSMTKQNADNARQADMLMGESRQAVEAANASMTQLIGSMEEITRASEETSKIIKTIDEIAFQTNLLALNAAVEAARAGEAGAGFAVVADEVRNLALRAADAARNTSTLIEGTVKKVKEGSTLVSGANETFKQLAASSVKVAGLVGEIAAASREQAQGIEEVNRAVSEMDKITQQNAAGAEESAAASEEMNAQAEQMKMHVQSLVALVEGGNGRNDNDFHVHGRPCVPEKAKAIYPVPVRKGKNLLPKAREIDPEQVIPMDDMDLRNF